MSPIELTLFTLLCTICAYLWGRYENRISSEKISEATIDILIKEGYVQIDKDRNLIKVNDEMVDSNSSFDKDS
tara:strand:- start:345 stop:563 length:219 start_codon:yes stop_codon:yes gene_type:complete